MLLWLGFGVAVMFENAAGSEQTKINKQTKINFVTIYRKT
jgi:hypothetical protein